jgi:hypothetical protein
VSVLHVVHERGYIIADTGSNLTAHSFLSNSKLLRRQPVLSFEWCGDDTVITIQPSRSLKTKFRYDAFQAKCVNAQVVRLALVPAHWWSSVPEKRVGLPCCRASICQYLYASRSLSIMDGTTSSPRNRSAPTLTGHIQPETH